MHGHWNEAARIELFEFRRQLLAFCQADVTARPRHLLFRQNDADLLRANREIVVIELEHRNFPKRPPHVPGRSTV